MAEAMEARTRRRIGRRILPFIVLLRVVSVLDRVNVGFAAITMNRDIGIGAEMSGAGAAVFFVGPAGCAVPSNAVPGIGMADIGANAAKPRFRTLPSSFLVGPAAAAGIVLADSLGPPGRSGSRPRGPARRPTASPWPRRPHSPPWQCCPRPGRSGLRGPGPRGQARASLPSTPRR